MITTEFFDLESSWNHCLKSAGATSLLLPVIIDCKTVGKNQLMHWLIQFIPDIKDKDRHDAWHQCDIVTLLQCHRWFCCRQTGPLVTNLDCANLAVPSIGQTEKLRDKDWDQRHVEPGRARVVRWERWERWEIRNYKTHGHTHCSLGSVTSSPGHIFTSILEHLAC